MTTSSTKEAWGADFFGGVNEMPPEARGLLDHVLVPMSTEPGFQAARRQMLRDLGITPQSAVFEAGCGSGAALDDILALAGRDASLTATDPTTGFIELASERAAAAGATRASYAVGDIRDIRQPDGSFDVAFCEKVLIHAGPAEAALSELVRVTKPGGRVGALEWMPYFIMSSTRPELVARFNGMLRQAVYYHGVSADLARLFHNAGLRDVRSQAHLATATSLDAHPFWRVFLIDQLPMFVHAGLMSSDEAGGLRDDLESLSSRGEFSVAVVVQTAVGTK